MSILTTKNLTKKKAQSFKPMKGLRLGIDLSREQPLVVAISGGFGKRETIGFVGQLTLPGGVVEQGEVLDAEQLLNILTEFIQANRLFAEYAMVAIPSAKAYVDRVVIDQSDDDDFISLQIEAHLESALNCEIEDIYYDYQPADSTEVNKENMTLAIAAMRRDPIQVWQNIFEQLHMPLRYVELEPYAFADATLALMQAPDTSQGVIVDVDENRARVMQVERGMVTFDQTMMILKEDWTESLSWSLDRLRGNLFAMGSGDIRQVPMILTGSRSGDEQVRGMVGDMFQQSLQLLLDRCPPGMDKAMWASISAAYGVAMGGRL